MNLNEKKNQILVTKFYDITQQWILVFNLYINEKILQGFNNRKKYMGQNEKPNCIWTKWISKKKMLLTSSLLDFFQKKNEHVKYQIIVQVDKE